MAGISKLEFTENFGKTIEECYGENLQKLKQQELLVEEGEKLCLTKRGIDISNYVFAELLYE